MEAEVLARLDDLIEEEKEAIARARKDGIKTVGYLCCKVPGELVHAHGMIPIRLACASDTYMATGKEYLHQTACPFMKSVVGELVSRDSWISENIDIIAGSAICLVVNQTLQILKKYTGKPIIYFSFPLKPPGGKEQVFFTKELRWFSQRLEEAGGRKLEAEELDESVRLYNDIRRCLGKIYQAQGNGAGTRKWSDVLRLIHAGFIFEPKRYLRLLHEVEKLTEMDVRRESLKADGFRIMLSGSPIAPGDNLLLEAVERSGCRIVTDNLCTGRRSFDGLVTKEPTIEGIAETYLSAPPCGAVQNTVLSEDMRLRHMVHLIKEYRVDGVVYYCLRFCDPYAFKDDETKRFLERDGVPLLAIHSDYGEAEVARFQTRIEGFVESLLTRRKRR